MFSILDTFNYNVVKDNDGNVTSQDQVASATADYYVMGWHSDIEDDVLHKATGKTRRERLISLSLALPETLAGSSAWLDATDPARIICHGAIYNVNWQNKKKPPTPADDWSQSLNSKQQVAIGTSPIDALLAYVKAHKADTPSDTKGKEILQLEEDIFNLRAYLRMQDDVSVDAYRKATDSLVHQNYTRSKGGTRYVFPAAETPTKPTADDLTNLQTLNSAQSLLDASQRALKAQSWELFSLWFKYFSSTAETIRTTPKQVTEAQARYDALKKVVDTQTAAVNLALKPKNISGAIKAVHSEYYQQEDPTVMLGGVKSGWMHDFLDKLKVRLDSQVFSVPSGSTSAIDPTTLTNSSIPTDIWPSMAKLLEEFSALGSNNDQSTADNDFPLYHDTGLESVDTGSDVGNDNDSNKGDKTETGSDGSGSNKNLDTSGPLWRDRWNNRQPWFPLFVEWQAEYVHVPWEDWELTKSVAGSSGLELTSYIIDPDIDLTKITDTRVVSGRILILPQPSFALKALITQVFSTIPSKDLTAIISNDEQQNLLKNVLKLPFLSAPLSGLTENLLTLAQGTHIKPSVRPRTGSPQAVTEALNKMFSKTTITNMGNELDPTPYGAQVHVMTDAHSPSPFKPVTHGQLRFTKINVIDKFGQAIHAILPSASPNGPFVDGVIPCVSEFYKVSPLTPPPAKIQPPAKGQPPTPTPQAHTASTDDTNGLAEFFQLPPNINQPARLNAHFVKRASTSDATLGWQPTTEWEDPIWGWIVINYVDYGIQLFTAEGIFYREVILPGSGANGRKGGAPSASWLPFNRTSQGTNTSQLDELIKLLTASDGVYLQAFLDMINGALKFSGPAPGQYAEALSCLVGRPLALVNMGWSLELAAPPKQNQSTLNTKESDYVLVGPADDTQIVYEFPIKLGDSHREYDGLVGYFPVKDWTVTKGKRELPINNEIDLTKIYTYFGLDQKPAKPGLSYPLLELDGASYPELSAFWLDPEKYGSTSSKTPASVASSYAQDFNNQLKVFGAVVDPFHAIHGYSSFLPTKELKLPAWTWEQALNHMTAFFHVGPVLTTQDVPEYSPEYVLSDDYSVNGTQQVYSKQKIDLPTNVAEWNWLQPYVNEDTKNPPAKDKSGDSDASSTTSNDIDFMPIALGRVDSIPRFENGPYTAIEGYLQMNKSIISQESNTKPTPKVPPVPPKNNKPVPEATPGGGKTGNGQNTGAKTDIKTKAK